MPCAHDAWTKFVDLYTPLIYYWARRMGLSSHDAADLVQEVLTTLVRSLPEFSYDRNKSFRGWLRTVTHNAWRHALRRGAQNVRVQTADFAELAAPDESDAFEQNEYTRHLVGRALDLMQSEFEPTTWRACWASIVDGMPAEAIARELGISRNAVYLAKSRVLRALRRELAGLLD
jgi:RNA polymerase sigma-70 factor, ECF subfamily